jgi:hypothetical protein
MILAATNNKVLTMIGVFMIITLVIAASFITQPALALKSKGVACKDKYKNVVCGKQSNFDQQKNVPFELPFP